MKPKKPAPPIYRDRKLAPTPEAFRDLTAPGARADSLRELLDGWRSALQSFLAGQGVEVVEAPAWDSLPAGYTWTSCDGVFAKYRADSVSPAVAEAIYALNTIQRAGAARGDERARLAFYAGVAVERVRATKAFAKAVAGYSKSGAKLRNKPTVTDEQIRASVARNRTLADAAAELGISVRQLGNRRNSMGAKKRKSGRLPTRQR